MNYSEIKNCDIANGPGVRVTLFVSGCTHHCVGCFNEMTWDFEYGMPFDAAAQERYLYAVMDPMAMNEEDLTAIGNYLAAITDAQVLTVDARAFSSMTDLEAALQADAVQRGGVVCGVQFFGTLDWDHEQLPWPTANLPLAEGAYTDFFDQYKAAEDYSKTPEVFAPNPAWPLFVGSAQITMS